MSHSEVVLRIPVCQPPRHLYWVETFSSTPDEDANDPHSMKGSFTQLGSASASVINLSTTFFLVLGRHLVIGTGNLRLFESLM